MSNTEPTPSQQKQQKVTVLEPGEIERFDNLLIRALFNDNIEAHATDEDREKVFGEIRGVCLARGLTQFTNDLASTGGSFIDVMMSYGSNVAAYMQDVFDNLHADSEKEKDLSVEEKTLLKFFVDHGVQPHPVRTRGEADEFLDGLRKFAMENGIQAKDFDRIAASVDEEESLHDEDCPCHLNNAESPEYSVVCPKHGRVYLSDTEYTEQLLDPDKGWFCPTCGAKSLLYDEEDC